MSHLHVLRILQVRIADNVAIAHRKTCNEKPPEYSGGFLILIRYKVLNLPHFPPAAARKGTEYADNYRLYDPKNMFFEKKYRNT